MPITVRTCDCFFDVGLYAQINHLKYSKFYKMCGIDSQTKNRIFFMTRNNYGFIVCCKSFLMDCIQTVVVKNLTKRLKTDCLLCSNKVDDNIFHYSMLKKLDSRDVNNKLRQFGHFYLADLTISKRNGLTKTCFEML